MDLSNLQKTPEKLGHYNNWATSWENLSSGVSKQLRLKPACSADVTS